MIEEPEEDEGLVLDEVEDDFQPVDWHEIGRQLVPHGELVIEEEGEDLRLTWPLSAGKISYTAVVPKAVAKALADWLVTSR